MQTSSTMVIDFTDNPDMREAFMGIDPGDKFNLKGVEGIVNEKDDQLMRISINRITVPGESETKTIKPSMKEPVMIRMMGKAGMRPSEVDEEGPEEDASEGPGDEASEGEGGDKVRGTLPKGILAGKTFRVGEEVVLKIVKISQGSIVVEYADDKATMDGGKGNRGDRQAQQVMTPEPSPSYA